ncbi:Asp23/Gls24 family envelope stress response protein [Actinomadura viridis]|uniref:Asp23/Gls24 family envelope stress response protein n=1 Tax=Actinomadura viridis TaxID=58110 RepID=UPI0036799B37
MTGALYTERGRTKIAERAIARIVVRAVAETESAGGLGRSLLGMNVGGRTARADVDVDGTLVTARVRMSVVYPYPVREVTHRVRHHVRERVENLTGLTVRQVDIDVAELARSASAAERRVS